MRIEREREIPIWQTHENTESLSAECTKQPLQYHISDMCMYAAFVGLGILCCAMHVIVMICLLIFQHSSSILYAIFLDDHCIIIKDLKIDSFFFVPVILTCCTARCRAAKCVRMGRAACLRRHNRPDSISVCSRSIPGGVAVKAHKGTV